MTAVDRYKVVFTTERGHRHQQAALVAAPEILDITMLRQPDKATLLTHLARADYLISERSGVVDDEMVRAAPKLKLVLRIGSLTHDIDIEALKTAGVVVCYWPVITVIRVAEHMVMQLLALGKRMRESETIALAGSSEWGESKRTNEDTFAYNWSDLKNVEGLWGKTIGILGLGEIGIELTRRLQNWGCSLIYNKRQRLPSDLENTLGLTYVDRDTLFAQSDYVANLLPYFTTTEMLISANVLSKMKDGACIVSCGSGSVIDEHALAEAISTGKLGGAALDTFEWEPVKADNPLIALAKANYNVFLTPHIAAGSTAAAHLQRQGDYDNILNHINGEPVKNRIA